MMLANLKGAFAKYSRAEFSEDLIPLATELQEAAIQILAQAQTGIGTISLVVGSAPY